ncbi:MAG: phosphoribosylamine--glycine ligase [Erysipelotrichaceae bacterium]|nr:phosphoribosylamine--glycine ligase [Erysipelotrichaceae bacterium]
MNTILIIGSGGREHALARCFRRSPTVEMVYVAPGNPGMNDVAETIDIKMDDFEGLAQFAKEKKINLVFVGPEAPLSLGIVDELRALGICIFGPTKKAAQLESSKNFAKIIMNKYDIPTAKHITVNTKEEALEVLKTHKAPIVIKADGLMAGKGVTVAMDDKDAYVAIQEIYTDDQVISPVVIEEYLEGEEFSLMAFVKGERVIAMDIARDHKRAYDNDKGPNTGGMGAYSPVPQISSDQIEEAMAKVMRPIAKAMVTEGIPFEGVLYGGLMATKEGIKTIEFNVRFGDPETEVLLPRLQVPLDQIIFDLMNDKEVSLKFDERFACGVVLASVGYPKAFEKGHLILGLDLVESQVYHMGTSFQDGFRNNSGRVLCVVELSETLQGAAEKVYAQIEKIEAPHLFHRHDIGINPNKR